MLFYFNFRFYMYYYLVGRLQIHWLKLIADSEINLFDSRLWTQLKDFTAAHDSS